MGLGKHQGIIRNLDGMGRLFKEVMGSWDLVRNLGRHSVGSQGISACIDSERRHTSGGIQGIVAGKLSS